MTDYAARAVAFYLPQFFPIPENDAWWGPGFTEWSNVAAARRLFPGHRQPLLPGELGFYDLRVPETRERQSALALEHGIEAFAYWHYWFGDGVRILERVVEEVVASGAPDIGFCLAWANQSWTGTWHGAPDRVLREQRYLGAEDDARHFATVLPALRDERYLRVDGRPVFYVFRPEELPSGAAFVDRWQGFARAAGLPGLYLVAEVSDLLGAGGRYRTAAADGFDAAVRMRLPARMTRGTKARMRLRRKAFGGGPEIYPYDEHAVEAMSGDGFTQPCVYPNWDNTPRAKRAGLVLTGADPDGYASNLRAAVDAVRDRPAQERLVWIKSWNEWAEGNHLEPDTVHGRAWLEATRSVLRPG
ncbi:glycoside hydrolase family 99-like domain-containing protein [Flexivirga sp. ID2601S]|uniref:Glycoside hydrolase family 99-like domain-containing protein n=1 Tax=Flexivirga aerilata TaxID=1656889 RepID=A0A849AJS5_9MICO|nr:glycoside hydrolase family 99-like domain-containing protein [Flexivirga aerilata]NNG40087.1 glycoside hydrolase family 99-like domain-containing protein [Flexivirga aerilata]